MVDAAIEQSMMELSEGDVRRYDMHYLDINISMVLPPEALFLSISQGWIWGGGEFLKVLCQC